MDDYYLNLTYQLAVQNEGNTSPNPSVGAVVVNNGGVAGWGFHPRAGEPHAEVIAIERAASRASGGTLFCSLEPCTHYGKTPPCVDRIIESGIKRVVYGSTDRNPLVNGRGQQHLLEHGIEVRQIHNSACEKFYSAFFRTFQTNRPYVILKAALTVNGIIAPADRSSKWITNESTRLWVHHLRGRCDAIMVGANTVRMDRPQLTVRIPGILRSPHRIIIDPQFHLNRAEVFPLQSEAPVLICGSCEAKLGEEEKWQRSGIRTLRYSDLNDLLLQLLTQGHRKILVEGGQRVFTWFYAAGSIDELVLTFAPRLVGGTNALNLLSGADQSLGSAHRMKLESLMRLDGDWIARLRPDNV